MTIMESINVKFNDYLLLVDYYRQEDPFMCSPPEEGDIISIPKDVATPDCQDNSPISKEV